MKIKVEKLKEYLKLLKPSFNINDLHVYGRFVYISNKIIMGYNGRTQIIHKLDYEDFFECILNIREFEKFLKKVTKETLTFEKNKSVIKVSAPNILYEIKEETKYLKQLKEQIWETNFKWLKLPEDFKKAIQMCIHSADQKPGFFNRILIDNHTVYSTDSYRVSKYTMKDSINTKIFLSLDTCIDFLKYDFEYYFIIKDTVYFTDKNKDIIFINRLIDEEYKDIEDMIAFGEGKGINFTLPNNVKEYLDISYIGADEFLDEFHKSIKVNIVQDKITITGKADNKQVTTVIEFPDNKQDITFTINPLCFQEILKVTKKVKIVDSIIVFYADNYIHLFSLGD